MLCCEDANEDCPPLNCYSCNNCCNNCCNCKHSDEEPPSYDQTITEQPLSNKAGFTKQRLG